MRLVDVADGVYFHGDIAILCDVMENVDDGWIELEMSPIMQKTRFMVLQVRLVFGVCVCGRERVMKEVVGCRENDIVFKGIDQLHK